MPIFASRLKGMDIVGSGTIVGKKDDLLEIYPFEASPEYCISPRFYALEAWHPASIRTYEETPNLVILELKQPWSFPNEITVTDVLIAADEKLSYYFSYYVKFIGDKSSYTFNFQYTVSASAKNG